MKFSHMLVIAVLSQGCLIKKAIVSNADYAVENEINKRLHLYSSQKDALSKDTDKFLNELKPRLMAILPLLRNLNLQLNSLDGDYKTIRVAYEEITLEYMGIFTRYLSILDKKQQTEFWETFEEATKKIKKNDQEDVSEKYEDRFEMFFGSVTDQQKKILKNLGAKHFDKIQNRLTKRAELKVSLTKQLETPDALTLRTTMTNHYLSSVDHEHNLQNLKTLIPTLTKEQHDAFRSKVKEIIELIDIFNKKKF